MNNIIISTPNEGKNEGKSFWFTVMPVYDFVKGQKTEKKKVVFQFQVAFQGSNASKVNLGSPILRMNQTVEMKNLPVIMKGYFNLTLKLRVPMSEFTKIYEQVCLGKLPSKKLEELVVFFKEDRQLTTLEGVTPVEDLIIYRAYSLKQQGRANPCCDKDGVQKLVNLETGEIQTRDKLPRKLPKEWVAFYNTNLLGVKGAERLVFENIHLDKLHRQFMRGEESSSFFNFE